MQKTIGYAAVAALTFALSPAYAAWRVDNRDSTFNFVSSKAAAPGVAAIQEVQTFKQIDGVVGDDGKLEFNVELGSVETNIPLRNERLKGMLFKVADNPTAVFTGTVDASQFKAMPLGAFANVSLNGQLTINGQSKLLSASLRVDKLASGALRVSTGVPIIVNLNDYGLQDGVTALRTMMNLNVLASSAPVTFSVVLKPEK
ncbi:YceI family protein [Paraburkholderia sediminicola]|uniref:YceI family protein n=1 Tax=Paraburkholderia sediminicola TaxID=458836 RepID=UPI0038BDAFA2